MTNVDVEVIHLSWKLKFWCKTLFVSNNLIIINFSSFKVYYWIKLVIKIINEVKSYSKWMKCKCSFSNSGFWFHFRNTCLKVSVKLSIILNHWFSLVSYCSFWLIFIKLMNTGKVLLNRNHLNHFHLVVNWFISSHFNKIKRILKLMLL